MKRAGFLGVCLVLALSPAAHAFDTLDDAYAGVIQAGQGLSAQAEDALRGFQPDLAAALDGFGRIAAQAGAAMGAHDGPADLGCIFRGMAEDAEARARQLAQAEDAAARRAALEDIRFLGQDAVLVTPEPQKQLAEAEDLLAGLPPLECAASAAPVSAAQLGDLGR